MLRRPQFRLYPVVVADHLLAMQGNKLLRVNGMEVGHVIRAYWARLHLATGNLRAARKQIRLLLGSDASNPQVGCCTACCG